MSISIPIKTAAISGLPPMEIGAEVVQSLPVDMGMALSVYAVVTINQVNKGPQIQVSLKQAESGAPGAVKSLGKAVTIYASESDGGVKKRQDGTAFVFDAATGVKKLVFEISGDKLDVANGFTLLSAELSGGQNEKQVYASMEYIIEPRYRLSRGA